jgi:NADPH:quinone reductase-like Zn-dependent oxidoreductase
LGADVTAVCSARNLALVRSLGAHHVADYATGGLLGEMRTKYDLIFDTVGVTSFASCKDALAEKGTYLPLNPGPREMWRGFLTSRSKGKRVKAAFSQNTQAGLETLVSLVEAGILRPVLDRVYPMAQIAEAHRHVEGRHKRGSVVISVDQVAA